MYGVMIKLMFLAAFLELGVSLTNWNDCQAPDCSVPLENKFRGVLEIDWKPISVFPEEAKRFQ
jgi:hypothetical protein